VRIQSSTYTQEKLENDAVTTTNIAAVAPLPDPTDVEGEAKETTKTVTALVPSNATNAKIGKFWNASLPLSPRTAGARMSCLETANALLPVAWVCR
jgi:hypothetical protein